MPVYTNEGAPLIDGKEVKHVRAGRRGEGALCEVATGLEALGYRVVRHANADRSRTAYADHARRRCPVCMPDSDHLGEGHNVPGVRKEMN
jgi:hypothetical protein